MNKSVGVFLSSCGVFSRDGQTGFGARRALVGSRLHQRRMGRGVWVFRHDRYHRLRRFTKKSSTVTSSATFTSGSLFDVGRRHAHLEEPDRGRRLPPGTERYRWRSSTGSIPSPVFFNRPRTLERNGARSQPQGNGDAPHDWLGRCRSASKFDVMVSGGPSFFRLDAGRHQQRARSARRAAHSRPWSPNDDHQRARRARPAINVGADATYIVWQNDSVRLGAGGFVRFTQASD